MKNLLLIAIVLCSVVQVNAQRKSFRGKVMDHNQNPIKGVEIYIDMKRIKERTNEKGRYAVKHPEEFQLVTVFSQKHGFINWEYNSEKKIDFIYPEDSEAMSREDFLALGFSAPILTKEHDKNAYASYGSILEILDKRFTDVRVLNDRIIVGRMGPSSVSTDLDPLILVNDIPTNITTLETIPTADVKSIRVISKGSESATYGMRAMNGVIIITLKNAEDESMP